MKKIFKYVLDVIDSQPLVLPKGSEIISATEQRGEIVLYALETRETEPEQYEIFIFGTGNPIEGDPGEFIGTVMLQHQTFVVHVFAKKVKS